MLTAILILSAWLHAAQGQAKDLPAVYPFLVESGDHGLMVLPRETLEQRSRDDDGDAGGPPAIFAAAPSAALAASTSLVPSTVAWHVPPAPAANPKTNPAAPRAPPFPLPL